MPYRIDIAHPPAGVLDRLIQLGALDVERTDDGLAAILPDHVPASVLSGAVGGDVRVTPARARDDGSVWIIAPREVRIGRVEIIPAESAPRDGAIRLLDSEAFGTGLHPTTALCLEAMEDEIDASPHDSVLDVGTGSGVLALSALTSGVPRAVAIDIDAAAIRAAAANARLNGLASQVALVQSGPEAVSGTWPLVLANVITASLIEMAPTLAWRVGRNGRLVLSGIRSSLAGDVEAAYKRRGLRRLRALDRDGWTALVFSAPW